MIILKKSVLFILASVFFIYSSIMMLISYLPRLLEHMGIEPPIITLTMTVFMSTFFIFPPFLGKYSDKIQNRIYFVKLGTVGMFFILILLLFAYNIILLNIELFILGFFTSFLTIYLTLYSELVQNDTKWISYYNAACAIGWFFGVVMGGIWIEIFSISNIIIFTLMSFIMSMIFIIFIKENRPAILNANKTLSESIDINANINNNNISSLIFSTFGLLEHNAG